MLFFVTVLLLTIATIGASTILLTDTVIKTARFVVDRQYGKHHSCVRLEFSDAKRFENEYDTIERLNSYREILERVERYTTWPQLQNFHDDWTTHRSQNRLPLHSIWNYKKDSDNSTRKKIVFFVHGGATFAGSPHKYNNLHWFMTLAWLGGLNERYTDMISIDYHLQPEYSLRQSIVDCSTTINMVLETYIDETIETVDLVGFSAGAMLCLQVCLLFEFGKDPNVRRQKFFNVRIDDPSIISTAKLLSNVTTKRRMYLLGPLVRLDRLFVNNTYDASYVMEMFNASLFDDSNYTYDPLFWMIVYQKSLSETFDLIKILDVALYSLSNHAITLYESMVQLNDINKIGKHKRIELTIFNEKDFMVNDDLATKIMTYDLRANGKVHKYLRDSIRLSDFTRANDRFAGANSLVLSDAFNFKRVLNAIHYHFFPYIVLCDASWRTMEELLIDRTPDTD